MPLAQGFALPRLATAAWRGAAVHAPGWGLIVSLAMEIALVGCERPIVAGTMPLRWPCDPTSTHLAQLLVLPREYLSTASISYLVGLASSSMGHVRVDHTREGGGSQPK